MGKRNNSKSKKKSMIHKHRHKKEKPMSPRKCRRALLNFNHSDNKQNTCPTEQKRMPAVFATGRQMELKNNTDDNSNTVSAQQPFQKFKDPSVKKPIKRSSDKKRKDNNCSYTQKLANSIKRRAFNPKHKTSPSGIKRKLTFTPTKQKMIQETLPKPKFYHNKQVIKPSIEQSLLNLYAMQLQQPVRGKMTLLNETIEDGETVEEIVSSDEDDCIVLEPVVPKIYLEDEDDSSDETQSNNDLDNVPSDNIPTTSRFAVHKRDKPFAADKGPSSFVVDKKPSRFALDKNPCHSTVDKDTSCVGLDKDFRYFLEDKRPTVTAWDRNRETKLSLGLNYPIKVASMTSHDCIVIDDSFDQSQRDDSPVRVVDDRKIINKQETPTSKYNDSVILLDDTKGNDDFISLPSDEGEPKRKVKKVIDKPKRTPKIVRQRMHNSLFTKTERKKLEVYNSNTYNPGTIASDLAITNKRPIIIDGSNVAYSHGCMNVFSTEGIKYCIDYFEMMGHNVKAVVPMFRKATHKTTNSALLEQLQKENKIVFTPCKQLPNFSSTCYDDRFILQLAYERNAAVVSNDNYRDLIHENPAFKKIIENRVIGYSWCDNILILPKDPYGRFGPALSQILHC